MFPLLPAPLLSILVPLLRARALLQPALPPPHPPPAVLRKALYLSHFQIWTDYYIVLRVLLLVLLPVLLLPPLLDLQERLALLVQSLLLVSLERHWLPFLAKGSDATRIRTCYFDLTVFFLSHSFFFLACCGYFQDFFKNIHTLALSTPWSFPCC